ncbi:glutaredoxin family protein [Macrococcus lamae]|uniref:Glutaredoxin family protein n=1 Tax=Macrococcus lamae TaxID=198484 RepID=A0A4R6BW10_9STAP|nr:glutaredoxin family protein [Macrococcus lamae]TDM12584.1 glutaredoxin family protein [Macrococcus lamae]
MSRINDNKHELELVMYTQPNCGLCDEAKIQLEFAREEIPFSYQEVDITKDDQLLELWQIRVPVLTYNDAIIQEGIIDFVTVIEELSKFD